MNKVNRSFVIKFITCCILMLSVFGLFNTSITYAASLDDVEYSISELAPEEQEVMSNIKEATQLEGSPTATKINDATKTVTSFIIQILAYFITACLAVRVVLDLCYITIPFTRTMLGNGYTGQAQQGQMGGMQGGMQGGMTNSLTGQPINIPNRMNMQGQQGGMQAQQGQMGQQNPASGKVQWVSTAALNAAASEQTGVNALKLYAKDMTSTLVVTGVLLTLAVTGVLTKLGFLLGDVLVNIIGKIGNMI